MAEILVSEGHNGGAISARVGDILTIQLPETPATGFRWTPATVDLSSLALAEDDFQLGAQSGVGGGGLRRWRFAAQRPGTTHLELRLARSWESGAPKAVFRVQVHVN